MTPKHPPGPPMTLGNMREMGVHHLIANCHNDACRHTALIDVSAYGDDVEVPSFRRRIKCGKCGRRGRCVDVRPNWTEASAAHKTALRLIADEAKRMDVDRIFVIGGRATGFQSISLFGPRNLAEANWIVWEL